HHNIMLDTMDDSMFYTANTSHYADGIYIYNNLCFTHSDWCTTYTNEFSNNQPFGGTIKPYGVGMAFKICTEAVDAGGGIFTNCMPQWWTNYLIFGNTVITGPGNGLNQGWGFINRYAAYNADRTGTGAVYIADSLVENNLVYNYNPNPANHGV